MKASFHIYVNIEDRVTHDALNAMGERLAHILAEDYGSPKVTGECRCEGNVHNHNNNDCDGREDGYDGAFITDADTNYMAETHPPRNGPAKISVRNDYIYKER